MTDNTTIFLDFWQDYQWPDTIPTTYKLYHNDDGEPITYSVEDLSGNYIDITADEFLSADMNVVVKDKKIHKIVFTRLSKLKPNNNTGTACHPNDITVIVNNDQPHKLWCLTHDKY